MPLYDYHCLACGGFRAWRDMSGAPDPVPCPSCDALAARAMVAPNLALMQATTRVAHQRNEKSAHEPQVASRSAADRAHAGHHRGHQGGAHHHHQHRHGAGSRPWMIGH